MDVFKSMPPKLQKIITDVGYEYSLDMAQATVNKHRKSLEVMKQAGTKMSDLPYEEKTRWANLMPNFAQQAVDKARSMGIPDPDKILNAWMEMQEKEGHKWPRKWVIK
jgi:TRAP-type C4-dicarboxylate transport system substrate-binding protein